MLVSKLLKLTVSRAKLSENIPPILVTFEVSNELKSRFVKLDSLLNIPRISLTLLVSKLSLKVIAFILEKPSNKCELFSFAITPAFAPIYKSYFELSDILGTTQAITSPFVLSSETFQLSVAISGTLLLSTNVALTIFSL